jgi:hypothetical protein
MPHLRSTAFVMVMQAADLRNLYHFAKFCILNRPSFWRILIER